MSGRIWTAGSAGVKGAGRGTGSVGAPRPARKGVARLAALLAAFALAIAALVAGTAEGNDALRAEGGVLDARGGIPASAGYLPIEGGWEFYWMEFLPPGGKELPAPDLYSPGLEWNRLSIDGSGARLPGQGYATYRMTILRDPGQDLALLVQRVYSSYRVYVDGRLAESAGSPGRSLGTTDPAFATRVVPLDGARADRVEVVIHVANYEQYKGGLCGYEPVYLGRVDAIRGLRQRKGAVLIFILGFLLMGLVLNVMLFLFSRPYERSYLYLAILCLVVAVVICIDVKAFAITVRYRLPWATREEINYAIQYIGTLVYILFLRKMFERDFPPALMRACAAALFVIAFLTMVLPAPASMGMYNVFIGFLCAFFAYCLYVLVRSVLFGEPTQRFFGLAYILLCMAVIVQSALYQRQAYLFDTVPMLHLLVSAIFLLDTAYLALDYRNALTNSRELSSSLEKKVAERTRDLEQSARIIETVNGEQKELLRLLCHDLTGPFISMKYLLDIFRDMPPGFDERRDRYLDEISGALRSSMSLIEGVRDSGADDELRAEPRLVDLAECFRLAGSISRGVRSEKGIRLSIDADEGLSAYTEPSLFVHSVLLNLIRNAVKFSPAGSTVRVSARASGGRIAIAVSDEGIGMPPEMLAKVLERPSECRRNGTEGESGSGFGLRLARKYTELFGGSLRLESEEGRGTTVVLELSGSEP